jgi:serine/threonine-protein kinase HipA
MQKNRIIYVFADWHSLEQPTLIGKLSTDYLRGKEVFSFEYDKNWLLSAYAQEIDPDLKLFSGKHFLNSEKKSNFGVFTDSSPDRWGRILMRRREAALALRDKRPELNLFETDYLLGVCDEHRMGGLRFKEQLDGDFLSTEKALASPPWSSIRTLEEISLKLEQEDVSNDPDYLKWLMLLVAPGSSLGGARPKASIVDSKNHLWIAKFPSKHDSFDIGAWEMVAYELALLSGINMSKCKAKKFYSEKHTFLTKRFDRQTNGKRIHFASAMTLLGYKDDTDAADGASYLELVEFISTHGSNPNADLEQLWKRVIFNICISNTDDHLRNHGFLLTPNGWTLSPAYDINPVETGTGLKLNITENNNTLDLDLALQTAQFYRLNESKALQIKSK